MLIPILLLSAALAGEVVVHAEVPAEVAVDGQPTAQLFRAGRLHLDVPDGERRVTVLVGGTPTHLRLQVDAAAATHVVVGRTGISTRREIRVDPEAGPAIVELRAVGREGLTVILGDRRIRLAPGDQQVLELPAGRHPAQLRSGDGLAIYATGLLDVQGPGPIVVQVSEGRAPEVVGVGGAWRPPER